MDNSERKITDQQTEQLSGANVIHGGHVEKIKEVYKGDVLDAVLYYLDAAEPESQGVAQVLKLYPQISYFEIVSTQYAGIYRIEITRCYFNGRYDDFEITSLYNDQNRLLYEKTLSIENGNSEEEVEKFFYPADGSEYLILKYDARTNSLIGASGGKPPFVPENNHFVMAGELQRYFPDFLTNNPYYANADMLP